MQKKKGISLTVLIVLIAVIIALVATGVVLLIPKETTNNNNSGITSSENTETKAGNWKQEGNKITNGKQTVNIGDVVHYKATGTDYEGQWRVLGVENGNVIIVSVGNVIQNYSFGETEKYVPIEQLENIWLTGVQRLNDACVPYAKGKGAISARSLNVEDFNKLIGYNPNTYEYPGNEVGNYGNKVTYAWDGDETPVYTSTNGANGKVTTKHEEGFRYYNGSTFVTVPVGTGEIGTIENTHYSYIMLFADKLKEEGGDKIVMMLAAMKEESLLATTYVCAHENFALSYGFFCTWSGRVDGLGLHSSMYYEELHSNLFIDSYNVGVRAVVTLSSDISFGGNETEGWTL